MAKRVLITGASGCIGHYVTEALLEDADLQLYLFVRDPAKLRLGATRPHGVTVVQGDMRQIDRIADLLKTMDAAVLAASGWGGTDAYEVNVTKTIDLLNLLSTGNCRQVLYFSTASVVDREHRPLREAGTVGTLYIRSKYHCLERIPGLAIAPRMTILFPTLVVGGDDQKPYSLASIGLVELVKWVDFLRFLRLDGSFHFIHGRDVAQVVRRCLYDPPAGAQPRALVLGQAPVTMDEAVEELCAYLGKKIYFRLPLAASLARLSVALRRGEDAAWARFCLRHRHFTHERPTNPGIFGLRNYCATLADVFQLSGIPRAAGA
jgi:nucleoside-diphosphate-sugar epimerase